MLKTFIKFEQVDYCGDRECTDEIVCFNDYPNYKSVLPAIPADVFKFIVDKSQANFWDAKHLRVGIADECGVFIQNVGTVEQGGDQYFVTATIPALIGPHRFVLYESLLIELFSITPETSPDACDAIVTFEIPTAPAEVFEWSLDGITYQLSSTFTGVCMEALTVFVRIVGNECTSGEEIIDLTPINCLDYKGWTLQQFQDAGIRLFQMYHCLLSELQP